MTGSTLMTMTPSRPATAVPVAPRRRTASRWAKVLVVLCVLVLLAGLGGTAGGRWLINTAAGAFTQQDLLGATQKATGRKGKIWTSVWGGSRLTGPVDILLMGVDARKRWAVDDLRADTIIAVHVPATHDRAYLVSVPRDTEMTVPAFPPSRYPGGVAKVNEAFFWGAQHGGGWAGGAQLMAQTLKENAGITFDAAAIIDFNGFKGVIDALHGVRLCVDQRVRSHHLVWVGDKPMFLAEARRTGKPQRPMWYEVGCHDMAGWQALDYSRQRYGLKNGDYDRQRHQQQLLKAIAAKAAGAGVLTDPAKVNELIKAAGRALVLDTGGVPVADYVFALDRIRADDLVLLRTNHGTFAGNGRGRERLTPESRAIYQAVRDDELGDFVISHPGVIVPAT
jgi:LCP family protein required for cell wall assembly